VGVKGWQGLGRLNTFQHVQLRDSQRRVLSRTARRGLRPLRRQGGASLPLGLAHDWANHPSHAGVSTVRGPASPLPRAASDADIDSPDPDGQGRSGAGDRRSGGNTTVADQRRPAPRKACRDPASPSSAPPPFVRHQLRPRFSTRRRVAPSSGEGQTQQAPPQTPPAAGGRLGPRNSAPHRLALPSAGIRGSCPDPSAAIQGTEVEVSLSR